MEDNIWQKLGDVDENILDKILLNKLKRIKDVEIKLEDNHKLGKYDNGNNYRKD